MSKIFTPTSSPLDWKVLLADPEKHWRPGFSAMSAALSWQDAKGLPAEIATIFGPNTELLLAIPEHKVAMPGRGRASQCDIFALVRAGVDTIAVAVEAKVDEPFGPTVREWLAAESVGKPIRLTAICAMLGCAPPPSDLRYQLFHRTAAAVIEAARFKTDRAAMVVQSFSQSLKWFDEFAAFARHLGVEVAPGQRADLTLPNGTVLTLAWVTSPVTA
ncbi:MAG: hypothetical protein ABI832_17575 [bacterium]